MAKGRTNIIAYTIDWIGFIILLLLKYQYSVIIATYSAVVFISALLGWWFSGVWQVAQLSLTHLHLHDCSLWEKNEYVMCIHMHTRAQHTHTHAHTRAQHTHTHTCTTHTHTCTTHTHTHTCTTTHIHTLRMLLSSESVENTGEVCWQFHIRE